MEEKIRIAGVIGESTVDGPGIRYVLFTQGCPHHCEDCHNPTTHDMNGGRIVELNQIIEDIEKDPLISGITLSGGEPFMQAKKLAKLLDKLDRNRYDIMVYTGFEYENLLKLSNEKNGFSELLKRIDVLVDGKFEKAKKDEMLMFKGSSNQRIIDCKNSLKEGKVIEAKVSDEGDISF